MFQVIGLASVVAQHHEYHDDPLFYSRPGDGDKEVIVDIEDANKTQYHEQNFNTSKLNLFSCQ